MGQMVTEFMNGGDLVNYISNLRPHARLSEQTASVFAYQILNGLAHMHAHGISHRDIKLENILIHLCPFTNQPVVKLADVGLAHDPTRHGVEVIDR